MQRSEKSSTSYSEYYEESLYKLQNGVLKVEPPLVIPHCSSSAFPKSHASS